MKKKVTYRPSKSHEPNMLHDALLAPADLPVPPPAMVRTQIYLSKPEYEFVQAEAARLDEPMAAVIRSYIDKNMELPDNAWTDNPMLRPTPDDPTWDSHEDGVINHDHYIYGTPKKWMKVKGKWVETPPLPDDYYDNPQTRRAYDGKVNNSR